MLVLQLGCGCGGMNVLAISILFGKCNILVASMVGARAMAMPNVLAHYAISVIVLIYQ